MRIVIDMQGAQTESRFRGIGRYSLSLAQAIVRNRGEHDIVLALNGLFHETIEPIRGAFDNLLPQENIRVWRSPTPLREVDPNNTWRREVAELIREAFLASLQPDVIHISSLFEGYFDDAVASIGLFDQTTPVSVSLYDLIPLLNPEHYLKPNPGYQLYYQRKTDHLSRASLLLAISEFSRQEGLTNLPTSSGRVVNISTAVDPHFKPVLLERLHTDRLQAKFRIFRPFLLYTGGADERKNLPRLIQAYAKLSPNLRQAYQLVLAGKIAEANLAHLRETAVKAGLGGEEILFTGYVTDEELVALYNLCTLFVFPSWHEGFGLPALEAMASGAAVIGANTTSLPEVIGREDATFDPFSVYAISKCMTHVLEDESFRQELRTHGLAQAQKYSWNESARRAITQFERLHKEHTGAQQGSLLGRLIPAIAEKTDSSVTIDNLKATAYAVDRCITEASCRQLFVDVSELVNRDAGTGVQRVTRSVLHQLLLRPPPGYSVEPVYTTTDQTSYRYARQFMRLEGSAPEDEPITARPGDVFLGLDLQHHTTRVQARYLSDLRDEGVFIYFVVYDLLPVKFPQFWPQEHLMHQVHSEWLATICRFDGAVCISQAVADELREWYEQNGPTRDRPFDIKWFHLGADVNNSVPSSGLPGNAHLVLEALRTGPTFLSVGTIEPRKGQAQMLAAFDLLWQAGLDIKLVLVGKRGWMVEALVEALREHSEFGKRLFWLEGISDEYLEQTYSVSTCLIAASEGEGFGLPLIEAAQHGLPIIARDLPVFREVAGGHAFYFSGMAATDLAQAIRTWLDLFSTGSHPKSETMPWLTWKESTQQLLEALPLRQTSPVQHSHDPMKTSCRPPTQAATDEAKLGVD
jgi:glycosyltransferase involved in cell wall biosynthesis